jgi:hypothetical protein
MGQFLRLKIRLTRTTVCLWKGWDWDYDRIVSRLWGSTVRFLPYGEGPGPMNETEMARIGSRRGFSSFLE